MNFYEQEMRQMFGNTDIIQDAKFVGKTMLGKLDDDLRVKLEFVATHIAGEFNAVRATMINRTDGVIDQQTFKFRDIIGPYHKKSGDLIDPHMWTYADKSEWYTPLTASLKARIADTVLDYVSLYQSEDQSMAGPTL